jgi:hypothetical protein
MRQKKSAVLQSNLSEKEQRESGRKIRDELFEAQVDLVKEHGYAKMKMAESDFPFKKIDEAFRPKFVDVHAQEADKGFSFTKFAGEEILSGGAAAAVGLAIKTAFPQVKIASAGFQLVKAMYDKFKKVGKVVGKATGGVVEEEEERKPLFYPPVLEERQKNVDLLTLLPEDQRNKVKKLVDVFKPPVLEERQKDTNLLSLLPEEQRNKFDKLAGILKPPVLEERHKNVDPLTLIPEVMKKYANIKGDDILAAVSNGEYVIKKDSVKDLGLKTLEHMNKTGSLPGFAAGGLVGSATGSSSSDSLDKLLANVLTKDDFERVATSAKGASPSKVVDALEKMARQRDNAEGDGDQESVIAANRIIDILTKQLVQQVGYKKGMEAVDDNFTFFSKKFKPEGNLFKTFC